MSGYFEYWNGGSAYLRVTFLDSGATLTAPHVGSNVNVLDNQPEPLLIWREETAHISPDGISG